LSYNEFMKFDPHTTLRVM